ncbi:MAG: Peptidase M50 [Microgenomates group bacterium GW2011_GWC1_44_10]|nr:MAG: Peptidase M50 [Microgenomates group bacterium GW2011_GWC1_44_10]
MLIYVLLLVIYLIISIGIHEFAHAFVADRLGDPTARAAGRLTLNPLAHIDLLGTVILPLSLLLFSAVSGISFVFGWGKPTPFDPYNLKNPRRDAAVISIAGPISNILLAVAISTLLRFTPYIFSVFLIPLIRTNIGLAIFNLIPVGPLDGQKILFGILPRDLAYEFQAITNRYGILILIFLIFPVFGNEAPITSIMTPAIEFLSHLLIP